jgi:SAM-dependent methyltransferase
MSDSVERFTNRVENYAKFRPDYPREIISYLREAAGLTRESVIADIGCGTGISSRLFLDNGNCVFGVEPNAAMRAEAERSLREFPWLILVDGTAENTGLKPESVDFVVAAQAFHWFDPARARKEWRRIAKPDGRIVLIWNERRLDQDDFHREYEALLVRFAIDYGSVRHDRIGAATLAEFFGGAPEHRSFENFQELDLEGLKGRILSASYMPSESDDRFEPCVKELEALFAKYERDGRIKIFYDTKVFLSHV